MDKLAKILDVSPIDIDMESYKECCTDEKSVGGVFPGWKSEEFTVEHRQKMSMAASKRVRTKDHLDKLHAGRRNSKNSIEHTKAVVASRLGSKHDDTAKKKMSSKKLQNPNTKVIASMAGKVSAEKRKNDPTYRLLQSQRAKLAWAKRKEGLVHGD